MTDRIYPSSKPNSNPPQTLNVNGNPSFPATKAQLYGATRPAYRPQPPRSRRHRRSCCCLCCLWSTLLIIALVFLAAIAAGVLYLLYHPQRPTFSVSTLRISRFNVTTTKDSTTHLNSQLDLAISARNPNKNIVFFYDPITVTVNSNGVHIGNGSFPSFTHGTKNTTKLTASISSGGGDLDAESINSLKSDLKRKNGLPLEIQMDTKVKVKMGSLKTKKVGIRVICDGIDVPVPKGKTPSSVSPSSNPKCKVDLRFKIWKWSF
ncbi:PREDICTED: protein YLS9-like [Nelumbo nucifera]|uniref:Protein YLS9-like n=2 Tax=Nelumbo nucifera TaxID=4432 RepID=A0A1U7YWA4_NELNU|nr:PREDICTED: protein YLS9-like [Nelumbo nucifera]DAD48998.1 TPA_asm: hypothetical protein HUJ06_018935 [Nelumbo nucifera]